MARQLRLEYDGALYHVTARGNGRQNIYLHDTDRDRFLTLLGEEVRQQQWRCYAYCLMANHYHLLLETPEGNLSQGRRRLNGRDTQAFKRRHQTGGACVARPIYQYSGGKRGLSVGALSVYCPQSGVGPMGSTGPRWAVEQLSSHGERRGGGLIGSMRGWALGAFIGQKTRRGGGMPNLFGKASTGPRHGRRFVDRLS